MISRLAHVLSWIPIATAAVTHSPDQSRFEVQVLASHLEDPMQSAPLPNGDILFIERNGTLNRYHANDQSTMPLGQIPVAIYAEMGLLGLAVDPNFESNQRCYLFLCPQEKRDHLRLIRVQLAVDGTIDPQQTRTILEYPFDADGAIHMGGGLAMNPRTGNLWIGTGDNCPPIPELPVDVSAQGTLRDALRTSGNTQDLRGKVLRIQPTHDGTYTIPDGNLFSSPDEGRPEIFAMGVRNAFRFAVDSQTGRIAWGDVGPNIAVDTNVGPNGYDEINITQQPGNFGWPMFVGPNESYRAFDYATRVAGKPFSIDRPLNLSPRNTGLKLLPPPQGATVWYPSFESDKFPSVASGGRSAMAGPFFHANSDLHSQTKLPDYYDNSLLIYDWTRNWIQALWFNEQHQATRLEPVAPQLELRKPIDIQLAHDHSLILVEFGDKWGGNTDGRLLRLIYRRGNRPPQARFSLSPNAGKAPLTVRCDSQASSDPDGQALSANWHIGAEKKEGRSISHTFEEPGEYSIVLHVEDPQGATHTITRSVVVGNAPPTIVFQSPKPGSFFEPGQRFEVKVDVQDEEDSIIDPIAVSIEGKYLGTRGDLDEHPGLSAIRSTTCFACHQTTTRSVGPAFIEIANRYGHDDSKRETLVGKIIRGGMGNWPPSQPNSPPIPMPPHPQHSPREVQLMLDWILDLQKRGKRLTQTGLKADLFVPHPTNRLMHGGSYRIIASYTDQGTPSTRPLSAESSITLHARKRRVALHDGSKEVDVIDVFERGEGLIARFKPKAWLRLNQVNLESIHHLDIRHRFPSKDMGGVEIRLDHLDGPILAKLPSRDPADHFETRRFPLIPSNKLHDLYFIAKQPAEISWIRFDSSPAR